MRNIKTNASIPITLAHANVLVFMNTIVQAFDLFASNGAFARVDVPSAKGFCRGMYQSINHDTNDDESSSVRLTFLTLIIKVVVTPCSLLLSVLCRS